jgi:hypothetical protein
MYQLAHQLLEIVNPSALLCSSVNEQRAEHGSNSA